MLPTFPPRSLLTPPNFRALSMHAPAKGNQLQQGACACIYVGQACERGEEQNPDSVSGLRSQRQHALRRSCGGSKCGAQPGLLCLQPCTLLNALFPTLQAYLFDISASEIPAASGAGYSGPSLVVDAATHRNEAAFANCVFGSGCEHNLKPQVRVPPQASECGNPAASVMLRPVKDTSMLTRFDRTVGWRGLLGL